jgi:flagellin
MRELAVQSSSDGLNTNDRFSIELEYAQLKDEVNRIANSTTYNNMTLINGDRAKDVARADIDSDGIKNFSVASNVATDNQFEFTTISGSKITLKNTTTNEEQTLHQPDGGFGEDDILNFDDLGITMTLGNNYDTIATEADSFTITQGDFVTMQVGADNDAAHASVSSSDLNGPTDKVTENRITLNISDTTASGLGISDSKVSALADSQRAINALDSAIEKVNDERSNIGALQNRFEFAVSNLQSSLQNTEASRSTILDADFALEAAGMARNQILTQSGTAMLAQANQISQNVLSLLK